MNLVYDRKYKSRLDPKSRFLVYDPKYYVVVYLYIAFSPK